MIEDMQLHGLAERTQKSYLQAVRQLAEHYYKSPDQISEEELRQYFLYLKNVKKAARNTCTLALCAIKFFYEHTLQRQWSTLEFIRPPREKKLPVVLSIAEVRRSLACIHRPRYRVCLSTIYACGLRLQEGLRCVKSPAVTRAWCTTCSSEFPLTPRSTWPKTAVSLAVRLAW
jgi:site-specific recombinase XerD